MAEVPERSKNNLMTLSKMKQFLSDGKSWDVQIEVDNKLFRCQRAVLAANSEYFYTMFSSEFEESNTTRTKDQPIILQQMDGAAFEKILHFMNTSEIRVSDSNVLQLLSMNDFLRLRTPDVKMRCLRHVKDCSKRNSPMSNALDLLSFASQKGEIVLVDTMRAHICRHLCHYSEDERVTEISFEILNALLEFSKNYIIPVRGSAGVLLKIVHKWVNHNREDRNQFCCKLIENIDFSNVSSSFVQSLSNRLEKAVEPINLSMDIESLSESIKDVDINLTDDDAQFEGLISFRCEKVTERLLDKTKLFSSSRIISGLSWEICIERIEDELNVSLICRSPVLTTSWNCYASALFAIVSHKKEGGDLAFIMGPVLFTSDEESACWGPQPFVKWKDLKNLENGFIGEDDSITIEADVTADVPFLRMI